MVEIPCGTVTFVFTDIEGSTRLWQESPEAMKVALELHDVLLRKTIEQHGGYVFKTVGDASNACITACDALEAIPSFSRIGNSALSLPLTAP
ncbi:MAG: hypothetical protein GC165_07340 [Armatimonadetes bacterium]|nr:hypothetical protein [Armatimonadota bacterium]